MLAQELTLRAGIAGTDITPSTLGPMYGYNNRRCGPANGTHDALHAKALVLEIGDSRMAIVTLDLGRIASRTLFKRVAEELRIPLLLLSVSHTHSAPAYGDESPYHAEVERKIFDAVKQASQTMFAAKLSVGRGSLQLGYNRLLLRDDGRARALFDNLDRIPHGPVDPEFQLLQVSDLNGAAKALLIHYAAHAVVLGPTSCKYSADYPGVLQSAVERAFDGTQVMFVQGGAGDINPLFQGRSGREDDDFAVMEKMGQLLAAEVLRAAKTIAPLAPVTDPIRVRSEVLTFGERWE